MNINIKSMILGPVQTNCYFVINEDTKELVIIDPADSSQQIIGAIAQEQLKPVAILLTHGHFDHIMAMEDLKKQYSIPVYVTKADNTLMSDSEQNGAFMIGVGITAQGTDWVKDQQELVLGGMLFQVIETPGHTAGGVCYYMPQVKKLFSGDTLFEGSIGRTDLATGSYAELVRSVKEKLFLLEDDVDVLSGHGPATTIGYEKKYNPFM